MISGIQLKTMNWKPCHPHFKFCRFALLWPITNPFQSQSSRQLKVGRDRDCPYYLKDTGWPVTLMYVTELIFKSKRMSISTLSGQDSPPGFRHWIFKIFKTTLISSRSKIWLGTFLSLPSLPPKIKYPF